VLEQRLPRRERDQGESGGVGERDARWRRGKDLNGCEDVLRRGAIRRHGQEPDDRLTDLEAAHARTERVDRAGDVEAGDVRQDHRDRALHEAAADVAVHAVEARRHDLDPHLPLTGDGLLDVLEAQDVGSAELVEPHCLHRLGPSSGVMWCSDVRGRLFLPGGAIG
jgi:hypothetical protein